MGTSSSSAAEKNLRIKIFKKFLIFLALSLLFAAIFYFYQSNNAYIDKTRKLNGSITNGDVLFKMNCVGCHGITARGLLGPDLHSITNRLSDSKIIKQVIEGLTPPMPSFEIDPQKMSDLLTYLHSLN